MPAMDDEGVDTRVEIEIWRVPTPIPRPVLTAAGPYDTYFHLVVIARRGEHMGWGYSGMATDALLDGACAFAASVFDERRMPLEALLRVERVGTDTASRGATNAIALAAWDLAAREHQLGAADLWGRRTGTEAIACYASGFFLDSTLDELHDEAQRYRDAGFRFVKMRTGLGVADDVQRFEVVAEHFPEPRSIAVDAFHSWSAADALAFIEAVDADLLWVEDAAPYDQIAALHPTGALIASAESLETTADVLSLVSSARLGAALLDVQRLGGPRNWLECAAAVAANHTRVGGHVYTPYSLHLMACVENPLPVEVFDWSDSLLVDVPGPDRHGRLAIAGPGFGVDLNLDTLARHGRRL